MTRIHIHIDRLTIEGRTPSEARRIVEALERHIGRLANSGDMTAAHTSKIRRMDAGTIPHGTGTDAIGARIATEVFKKLGGPPNG